MHAADSPATRLALEVLENFGRLRLRAWGQSMLPSLWPGDLLTLERCRPEELQVGRIVLYRRDDRLFIHRIISICTTERVPWIVTQGDANPDPDPPFPASDVFGVVTDIARGVRGVRRARWGRMPRVASFLFRQRWSSRLALRVHAVRRSMAV